MSKEVHHSQFEDSLVMGNTSPKETEGRVLRRMILEVLPHMIVWAENKRKDSVTITTLKDTLKRKENFERVSQEDWKELLEEFLEKNIELIILKNPLEIKDFKPSKNPLIKRMEELMETPAGEDTLLLGWHLSSGLLAASFPCPEATLHKFFPKIITKFLVIPDKKPRRYDDDDNDRICIWTWDRSNFLPPLVD
jgi:hypothetical protein